MADYRLIGPLAYRGKKDCTSPVCTRIRHRDTGETRCYGWHCSYCDEPTGDQGHSCDAADAVLGEARRVAKEDPE
jgi:hypothetical protein